jgi:hypothetical protein
MDDKFIKDKFEEYKSNDDQRYQLYIDNKPLVERDITKTELDTVLNTIQDKPETGGSRKTKRSLPKHKKHKTEKKKNYTS